MKKINKSSFIKMFLASTTLFVVVFITSSYLLSSLSSNEVFLAKNSRDVKPSDLSSVEEIEISNLGADISDFKNEFQLARSNLVPYNSEGTVGNIKIDENKNINWALNGSIGENAIGSSFSMISNGNQNSILLNILFSLWGNTPNFSNNINDGLNSLFIQQKNALPNKSQDNSNEYIYNDLINSNNKIELRKTYITAPPFLEDALSKPADVNGPLFYYMMVKKPNADFPDRIYLENPSPVLINYSIKTSNIVPNTSNESSYNYNPYIKANIVGNSNQDNILSGTSNSQLNPRALDYGMYFDPIEHVSYFSGIIDAIPSSSLTKERTRLFGQYVPTASTRVFNFQVKTSSNSDMLPSEKIKEIKNSRNYFNNSNFSIFAENAIPSTFYGAKLKLIGDDDRGTITYQFIPGVGVDVNNYTNYNDGKYFSFNNNASLVPEVVQGNWKTIEDTRVVNSISITSDEFLYNDAIYAQIATENRYLNELKYLIKRKIIFGNVTSEFGIDDIFIENINYSNKDGLITFDLYLSNFFRNSKIVKQKTNFGQITISGFEKVTAATEIAINEINIDSSVPIYEWLSTPDLQENIVNKIVSSNAIVNLPKRGKTSVDLNKKKIENHPPKITIPVLLDKYFEYNEVKDDFLIIVPNTDDGNNFYNFGDISFVGFEEIFPTKIEIPNDLLDNNRTIYPSQYSQNDAKQLVFENVVNPPKNFSIDNVIIDNFVVDPTGGEVRFNAKLSRFYDDSLTLQTSADNFIPLPIRIVNFKKSPGPTSYLPEYGSKDWSEISTSSFTDDQIIETLKNNVFKNILSESNFTFNEIVRDNKFGEIRLSGTVDIYFDENNQYRNVADGAEPFPFEIKLVNFLINYETVINTNILNVSLPEISPTDVLEKLLKSKLHAVIRGEPRNFSDDNILFTYPDGVRHYVPDNVNGELVVNLGLNYWNDASGQLHTTFKDFGTFTFIGFKKTTETILSPDDFKTAGNGYIASQVANNKIDLITIINSKIQGSKPEQWNPMEDIIICNSIGEPTDKVVYNNESGTLHVYVKLKRYYDENGILQTQWNKPPIDITIKGFQKLVSSSVINEFLVPNYSTILASNSSSETDIKFILKKYTKQIFLNFPSNFNVLDDVIVRLDNAISPNPNNLTGEITIEYEITNYFNSEGIQETNPSRPLCGKLLLTGFRQITETTVQKNVLLQRYEDVVASTLQKQQVIDIVNQNKDIIFDSQPDTGVLIQNVNITNNQLNLEGLLEIEITFTNYYDAKGDLITSPKTVGNILLEGFKIVYPTRVYTRITLPEKSQLLPNELTTPVITSILTEKSILPLFLVNPTPNFSARDIQSLEILGFDNLRGSIAVSLKIINYYDTKGNVELIKPLTIDRLVIQNFSSNKATSFSNEINILPNSPFSTRLASSILNQELRNFIYENISSITSGLPSNFNPSNIRIVEVEECDNLNGIMYLKVGITNYIDDNGILQTSKIYEWNVTINGFRSIVSTEIKSDLVLLDVSNIKPSDVDNAEAISIIMRNKNDIFNSLPDNFNEQNIIINSLMPNDSDGRLSISISITSYYDEEGNIAGTDNPLKHTITFSGFGNTQPTIIKSSFKIKNVSNIIASEYTSLQLKQQIFFNLDSIIPSLPSDFKINDIRNVEIKNVDNKRGSINANVSITNYYRSDNGLVDTINTLTSEINFTGFKEIGKTQAVSEFNIGTSSMATASEYNTDEIFELISLFYNQIFSPLPTTFTKNNIINVKIISIDNKTAKMNVEVTLNLYFNEKADIVNENKKFYLTLTGFMPVTPTIFIETVRLGSISHISAYSLSPQEIIQLIYKNKNKFIQNPGPNFSISNINFKSIDSINNSEGMLEVSINYTNYYDENGYLILGTSITKTHFIYGFSKNSKKTELINSTFFLPGYHEILAQDIAKNTNKIKEIIFQNVSEIFKDIPNNVTINDITLADINFDNIKGHLILKIYLSKYYNSNSILINDPTKKISFNLTISGFKNVSQTTQKIFDIFIPNYSEILASSLTDITSIKNYVWSNRETIFDSLPENLSVNDINIEISDIDNLTGKLCIYITLYKWYSTIGELQTSSSSDFKLTLLGFKSIIPTEVNTNINLSFPPVISSNALFAETINLEELKMVIVYNKNIIFNSIPDDFSTLNIQGIQIISRDNINGIVKAKFSFFNYFNNHGNVEKNQTFITEEITFRGFLKAHSTSIVEMISIADECSNKLASDYVAESFNELNKIILSKREEIFNGTLPLNANIQLLSIDSYNNLDGTANASISIDKYYDQNGKLVNDNKIFNLKLIGFKSITTSSTIAGENFSINNNYINININQFDEVYNKYFSSIYASNISSSPESFIKIITMALNSPTILKQNGLVDQGYNPIKIENLVYKPNSANDLSGKIVFNAFVTNYWDNINGTFSSTPLPIIIELSGLKTTLSSEVSPMKIVALFLIIVVTITICLLIALLIAKLPKIFKKKI